MSSDGRMQWGTSGPISILAPSSADLRANDNLLTYLRNRGDIFESSEEMQARIIVIDKLNKILKDWAVIVGRNKNISEEQLKDGGGIQLKIFGSTRLGVNTPDADIDSLCIAPSFISKDDFFSSLCLTLQARSDVSVLSSIPDAFTPVIKFNIDMQPIDMIFVSLAVNVVPNDIDVLDDVYLRGLDEKGIRSLNGCRVAEHIIRLVPNFDSFCISLRAIKHWARQKGIYSNVLGFLGGVNYAILVAFVCQKYPNACPASLVHKFFAFYSQWPWPSPIMICSVEDHNPINQDGIYVPVWNPRLNHKDAQHLMPILTPAFPTMNSAYNVGISQYRSIKEQIIRADELFRSSASVENFNWNTLFESSAPDFFKKYNRYVEVDIGATNQEDHRTWFGFVESRLRLLFISFEKPPVSCYPQTNCFYRQVHYLSTGQSFGEEAFRKDSSSGGSQSLESQSTVNEEENFKNVPAFEASTMYRSSFFIGLLFEPYKYVDLSETISDFFNRVCSWEKKIASMEISVTIQDQHSLPSFVNEMASQPSSVKNCTPIKNPEDSNHSQEDYQHSRYCSEESHSHQDPSESTSSFASSSILSSSNAEDQAISEPTHLESNIPSNSQSNDNVSESSLHSISLDSYLSHATSHPSPPASPKSLSSSTSAFQPASLVSKFESLAVSSVPTSSNAIASTSSPSPVSRGGGHGGSYRHGSHSASPSPKLMSRNSRRYHQSDSNLARRRTGSFEESSAAFVGSLYPGIVPSTTMMSSFDQNLYFIQNIPPPGYHYQYSMSNANVNMLAYPVNAQRSIPHMRPNSNSAMMSTNSSNPSRSISQSSSPLHVPVSPNTVGSVSNNLVINTKNGSRPSTPNNTNNNVNVNSSYSVSSPGVFSNSNNVMNVSPGHSSNGHPHGHSSVVSNSAFINANGSGPVSPASIRTGNVDMTYPNNLGASYSYAQHPMNSYSTHSLTASPSRAHVSPNIPSSNLYNPQYFIDPSQNYPHSGNFIMQPAAAQVYYDMNMNQNTIILQPSNGGEMMSAPQFMGHHQVEYSSSHRPRGKNKPKQ